MSPNKINILCCKLQLLVQVLFDFDEDNDDEAKFLVVVNMICLVGTQNLLLYYMFRLARILKCKQVRFLLLLIYQAIHQ